MKEETISVNGKSIHTRQSEGHDSAYPTLLCIHGNLGSGRWFEPLLADYPGHAVAPDMPNFGQSDHIDACTIPAYAGWVAAIMDTLGIGSAAVLGHSLGGAVAMELLVRKPALVERLILVDSSPIDGLVTPKEHYPAIEAYKADKNILAQALRTVVPTIKDEAFFAKLVDDAWAMNRECFIGHAEALADAVYTEKLKGVAIPTDVISGGLDVLITTERAHEMATFFGGGAHRFPASGHSPMVEIPDEFNELIRTILRGEA